jgi:aminobutyraldehyde dehydrogenase
MPVVNPATGVPVAEAPEASLKDLAAAISAARAAFPTWAATLHGERARRVREGRPSSPQ